MNIKRVPAYMELNGHKTEIGTALVDNDMGCATISVTNTSAIDILRAKSIGNVSVSSECSDHKPRQHRDGKPPWCRACGLTANFELPVGIFQREKEEPTSDHEFTD